MRTFINTVLSFLLLSAPVFASDDLHIMITGDIHGEYSALPSVKYYVDSIRNVAGRDNTLLIDLGDGVQGSNASYYFNYKESKATHLFPRMLKYMGYEAAIVGNHDIETGHDVYDRLRDQFSGLSVPYLAANAIFAKSKQPYFGTCATYHRAGKKIVIIGYTNANMKAWLNESIWKGIDFLDLNEVVKKDVARIKNVIKPDFIILALHSGLGKGDGQQLENQAADLVKNIKDVNVVLCGHDHKPVTSVINEKLVMNCGSRNASLAHGVVSFDEKGKVNFSSELIKIDRTKLDENMQEAFKEDFRKVEEFSNSYVGELGVNLVSRDAYKGMCPMLNLIHTVQLSDTPALISFAAPLSFNKSVPAGSLVFNDMFSIYPYENSLFVVNMSGKEIKNYLEYSYGTWINTISHRDSTLLKIERKEDPECGKDKWMFKNRSYNFDSAAGINYTVDVTRPVGSRVNIASMSNGEPFNEESIYPVAMTSYRASGGGDIMIKGAGIDCSQIESRIVVKCKDVRTMIYDYIKKNGPISEEKISDPQLLGSWEFVPSELAQPILENDMNLLFPSRQ